MAQDPILTVTLNPALDVSACTASVTPGPKLRLEAPRHDPGGGGINVARAVLRLGGEASALAVLGGAMGAQVAHLLATEGVPLLPFDIAEETRHSLSVTDRATGAQYRFVLPGAQWPDGRDAQLLDAIAGAAPAACWAVLSGSQPPGLAADFPHRLAERLGDAVRLIVDTSGPALANLIETPPRPPLAVLRLDQTEAEAAAGQPLAQVADSAAFGQDLVARGVARMVVLARGADGNVLAEAGQGLHCRPPEVTVDSPVGAGDSFTAGLTLALARGESRPEALRFGTAAAAAAVMTAGTELCHLRDVERLLPGCRLHRL